MQKRHLSDRQTSVLREKIKEKKEAGEWILLITK